MASSRFTRSPRLSVPRFVSRIEASITWTVKDAALILEVIAGPDEFDSTSSREEVPPYSELLHRDGFPRRIAYLEEPLQHPGLDPEIKSQTEEIIQKLRSEGFTVDALSFPYLDYLVPAYYVMATAEASSNLARYDGIHYGYRSQDATDTKNIYIRSRSEGFGTEVKRRIMTGTFVLSAGYYDAYYGKAQKARRLIYENTLNILSEYAFILLPTTPRPAFKAGTMGDDPVALYLEDIFTIHANLVGIPAISIPIGKHSSGLPFGVQLMTSRHQEASLLSLSNFMLNTWPEMRFPE
jgi:aspartyl-tRNA(Asn)/glutamyl-tRNA(Gln) amidotransferase subunit A